jgi:hypothetical protein
MFLLPYQRKKQIMAFGMLLRVVFLLTIALAVLPADGPLPKLQSEPTENGSLIRIRNVGSQPLTAYLIEIVDYPGNEFALLQDLVEGEPMAAGAEKSVTVSSLMPGTVPEYLKVQAAVYADGSSAGVPEKIKQVLEARRSRLRTTRELIRRIEEAQAAGTPGSTLEGELTKWSGSDPAVTRGVISQAVSQLRTARAEEVLAALRASERTLAISKPLL